MRRQHFEWTFLVLALVLTIYGGYSLLYNHIKKKAMSVLGLVFFIIGCVLLITFIVLVVISYFQKKKAIKNQENKEPEIAEKPAEIAEKPAKTPQIEKDLDEEDEPEPIVRSTPDSEVTYVRTAPRSTPRFEGGSGYIKLVGYGPVLRVENDQILDMRNNTYYRIEGNLVKQMGGGPVFEINGNSIKLAFGGYLYEISGSSINKVYGGFYASISGNYIQTFDLKQKYEMTDSFNKKQILAIAALIFGTY